MSFSPALVGYTVPVLLRVGHMHQIIAQGGYIWATQLTEIELFPHLVAALKTKLDDLHQQPLAQVGDARSLNTLAHAMVEVVELLHVIPQLLSGMPHVKDARPLPWIDIANKLWQLQQSPPTALTFTARKAALATLLPVVQPSLKSQLADAVVLASTPENPVHFNWQGVLDKTESKRATQGTYTSLLVHDMLLPPSHPMLAHFAQAGVLPRVSNLPLNPATALTEADLAACEQSLSIRAA